MESLHARGACFLENEAPATYSVLTAELATGRLLKSIVTSVDPGVVPPLPTPPWWFRLASCGEFALMPMHCTELLHSARAWPENVPSIRTTARHTAKLRIIMLGPDQVGLGRG